jgi:hypothetical protein
VTKIGSPVDLAMNDQLKNGFLKGYTVIPPLVTPWKVGGIKDSDIDEMERRRN